MNVSTANLTRGEYLLFTELLGEVAGFKFSEGESPALRSALCERLAATGKSGFGEYYEVLRSPAGAGELRTLVEMLTVHETAFFRNRTHFTLLARRVVPQLLARNAGSRTLRMWSAGCSTGQEAYSIAISLLESIPDADSWRVEVVATDISHRALEIARQAVYPGRAVRTVDPLLLDRYFEPDGDRYRVSERARRLVRFEYLNLVKEPFPLAAFSPCDVVFCENVTIYFKIESTRRVVRNFYETLSEGGYLFLGYSETLWQISDDFVLRDVDDTFVYQKSAREPGQRDQPSRGRTPPAKADKYSSGSRPWPTRFVASSRPAPPPRRRATVEEVEALYEARRHAEALLAVESVLAVAPSDPRAQLLAAKLRADREEIGPALRHCRRAVEADPLLEEAHYLMGVLLMRAGDDQAAVDSLSRVVYLNPSGVRSALSHFHLAGLHTGANRVDKAVRECRNALRLLERLPREELVEEFSADFLARVCRRRLEEMECAL